MELNYSELKLRDVINVNDGRCLGKIIDIRLSFPKGVLVGITVPGRKRSPLCFFDKSELYIERSKIIKIGGDVILVNLKGGDSFEQNGVAEKIDCPRPPHCPPNNKIPPCPPKKDNNCIDLSGICDKNGRIDLDDY